MKMHFTKRVYAACVCPQVTRAPTRVQYFSTRPAETGSVTIEKNRLTLWLGADGLPVSAERLRAGERGHAFVHRNRHRSIRVSHAPRMSYQLFPRLVAKTEALTRRNARAGSPPAAPSP